MRMLLVTADVSRGRVSRLSGGGEWLVYLMPLMKFHLLLIPIGAWGGTHSHGDTPGPPVKASQTEVHPSSGHRGEAASNVVTHTSKPST